MKPDEHDVEYKRLQDQTRQNLVRLMDSEMSLAITMSELAETEAGMGDKPHAKVLLQKVEEAMDTVHRHMADNQLSEDESSEIQLRVQKIQHRLDAARRTVLGNG